MEIKRRTKDIPLWNKLKTFSVFHHYNLHLNTRDSAFVMLLFWITEAVQRLGILHFRFPERSGINIFHRYFYGHISDSASLLFLVREKNFAIELGESPGTMSQSSTDTLTVILGL